VVKKKRGSISTQARFSIASSCDGGFKGGKLKHERRSRLWDTRPF